MKLMKETEDDTKKETDILYSWTRRTDIVKMYILPKAVYRVHAVPIDIHGIFNRTQTNNPKIGMKLQKTTNNHSNSEKEEKNLEVPRYCKTIVIKTG